MMQDDFDWTEGERDGLQSYGANVTPSETLRQRTMNALREQNLLGTRSRRVRVVRPAVGIAAAIAIFAAAAAANYLTDRSQSNQNVVGSTADTTRIERHVIWF